MLNLDQPDLHNVLIAGVSGAGKSSLMRSIAISLALTCRQSQAQLAAIGLGSAPSGITRRPNPLYPVNYLPHLLFPMATEVDEVIEALAYLAQEVAYRADHHITTPALIIMVDDADMLLRRVGGPVAEQLAALLHAPAEAGVRVLVGASNPTLPDLWRMLRHNVDLRLVGRMADERSAQHATGLEKSYAEYLDGKGDFIAVSAAGVQPFQAADIDDYDLHLTLTELHRASGPILLAQTPEDKRSLPPSWSAPGEQGFTYDPVAGRAEMESDDRGRLDTIEIAVDSVDRPPAPEQHLSWLDDAGMGGLNGGLSLPLPAETREDHHGAPEGEAYHYRKAWEAFAGRAMDEEEPDRSASQEEAGKAEPPGQQHRPPANNLSPAGKVDEPDEMLPFDEEALQHDAAPDAEALEQKEVAQEEPQHEARPWRDLGMALPSKERARKLWSVEPIYTDIEDDNWEVADDDDDDWRNRLH
ncbi:MAG: FtsK/SpoIIIE domain-containing protein, partial [Candidatus Promineifilaceae bacterium]